MATWGQWPPGEDVDEAAGYERRKRLLYVQYDVKLNIIKRDMVYAHRHIKLALRWDYHNHALDKWLICLTKKYFVSKDMRLCLSKYTLILSLVNGLWFFLNKRSGLRRNVHYYVVIQNYH